MTSAPPPLPAERGRSRLAVVGGGAIGLVLGFFVVPVAAILTIERLARGADYSNEAGVPYGVLGVCVPILVGAMLLVPRGVRRAGRGLGLGIAVGMIVGAVLCLALVGWTASTYDGGPA